MSGRTLAVAVLLTLSVLSLGVFASATAADDGGDRTVAVGVHADPATGALVVDLRSISYNQTRQGEIDTGDPEGYRGYYEPVTFNGTAGDIVTITMTSSGDTYLILNGPNGSEIARNDDSSDLSDYNSRIENVTLPKNGTYTIIATSYDSSATFQYNLTLNKTGTTTLPPDLRSIAYNQTRPGEIDTYDPTGYRGYYEPVSFNGTAGDIVAIDMTSGDDTYLILHGPNGTEIARNDDGGSGLNSTIQDVTLATNGTYTIIATSYSSSATFPYNLTLNRTGTGPPPPDPRSISYNQTKAGQIDIGDPTGYRGYYEPITFNGTADNVVSVEMASSSDSYLLLLGPNGTEIARNNDGGGGADARLDTVTLPDNGTYTIVATSDSNSSLFSYDVTLTRNALSNRPPTATNDTYYRWKNETLSPSAPGVLGNDTDPEGDTLNASVVSGPPNGSVTLYANGSFEYTPDTGFTGTDTFRYEVSDGYGGTDRATVTVDVSRRSLAYNETRPSRLGTNDPTGYRGYYEPITFNGTAGDVVRIDMTSSGDTYLILHGPNGTEIARDDDGGSGVNSRIQDLTLATNGTYTIIATSYSSSATFDYEVSLERTGTGPPPPDPRSISYNQTKAGQIDIGDPTGYRGYYEPITFNGTADDVVSVEMVSSSDSYLLLLGPNGTEIARNNDGGGGADARLDTVTLPDNGTYTIVATSDSNSSLFSYDVTLTRNSLSNRPPTASNDSYATFKHRTLRPSAPGVLGNDTDPEGDALNASLVSGPSNGSVTLFANGSFEYTPDTGFNGTDSFRYEVSDGYGGTDRATVSLTVRNLSLAYNDSLSSELNTYDPTGYRGYYEPVTFNGTAGDGVTITMTSSGDTYLILNGPNGNEIARNDDSGELSDLNSRIDNVTLPETGTYTIIATSYDSSATFPYDLNLTVEYDNNAAPVPRNDSYATTANVTLSRSAPGVLGNDSDPDGDALTVTTTPVTPPSNGSVTLYANGSFEYTPDTGFTGNDSFTYEVSDGDLTATATVTVSIVDDDLRSIGYDQTKPGKIDTGDPTGYRGYYEPVTFNGTAGHVVTIDMVSDGDTYLVLQGPNGTELGRDNDGGSGTDARIEAVTLPTNGTYTIVATSNDSSATFPYDLRLRVDYPPTATDDTYDTSTNETLTVSAPGVLGNDSDPDGDALTVTTTPVTPPSNGSVTLYANGSFEYVPDTGFEGQDRFTYEVSDGNSTDTATVTISVVDNDLRSIAYNQTRPGKLDTDDPTGYRGYYEPVTFDGVAGDGVTIDMTSSGDTYLILNGPNGTEIARNDDGGSGYNSRIDNVTLPDTGTYTIIATSYDSSATFPYNLSLTLNYDANAPPTASNDSYTALVNGTLSRSAPGVLGNDSDPDGDALTVTTTPVTPPSNGSVTLYANGSFEYTPDTGFTGNDSFTYEVSDGNLTATATVTVNVVDGDLRSIGYDQTKPGKIDTGDPTGYRGYYEPVTFNGTAGHVVTVDMVSDGDTYLVVNAPNGTEIARNNDGGNGTDARVDNLTLPDTGTYTIVATSNDPTATFPYELTLAVNRPPDAAPDNYTTPGNTTLSVSAPGVLGNDTDPEGDALTVTTTPVAPPSNGTVTLFANGSFEYTPDPGYTGQDSFTYEVDDGSATDTATVTVDVIPRTEVGLVARWPFENVTGDTAPDVVGDYDGLITGANNTTTAIEGDRALRFDGSDDNVDTSLQTDQTQSLTFSVWARPDEDTSTASREHVISADNSGYDWGILQENDNWHFFTGSDSVNSGVDARAGTWYHLVAVYDVPNGTATLYVNGTQATTASLGTDTSTETVRIGDSPDYDEHFDGVIDDPRVYNRSLSPEVVQLLYESAADGDGQANFSVAINATSDAVEGENLTVTADVTNTASTPQEQNVTLAINGTQEDVRPNLNLSAGETRTVNLTWETAVGDAGTYVANVSTANDSASQQVQVLEPANYAVNVTDTNEPGSGDNLTVTANVTNTGEATPTQNVTLAINGTVVDWTNVSVAAGTNETVTLVWNTDSSDRGTYVANVSSADDYDTQTVNVVAPANYTVNVTGATEPAAGEPLDVTAEINNTGDASPDQTVTLAINGTVVNSTTVNVSAGTNETVTLTWSTAEGDAGQYVANVSSEDDSDTTNVTVLESATYNVSITNATTPVNEGENLTVTAEVNNTGDVDGSQTLELAMNGTVVASEGDVNVSAGATETVNITWETQAGDAGQYVATVSSEDDADTTNVTVLQDATFAVAIANTTSPVVENETMLVNATVSNNGDESGTQTVALRDFDGVEVDNTTVSLSPGENASVTLAWATEVGDAGTNDVTVASENGTDTATVTVEHLVFFAVNVTNTTSTEEGQVMTVTANVTNTGYDNGTEDVVLYVDGDDEDVAENVSLGVGENASVTLDWQTYPGDAGNHTVTVESDEDSDTETVNVSERPPITECGVIDQPGEYYLGADIYNDTVDTCLDVRADGVTIHGQGYRIDGGDGNGTAIHVPTGGTSTTVENLTLVNWGTGVAVEAADVRVLDADVTATGRGIHVFGAENASLVDNTVRVTGAGSTALDVESSPRSTLADSVVENGTEGVSVTRSPNATVRNVTASATVRGVVVASSNDTTVRASNVTDSGRGFEVTDSYDVTVVENRAYNVSEGFVFDGVGGTVRALTANDTDRFGLSIRGQLRATQVEVDGPNASNATLSFTAGNVTVEEATDPPENPRGLSIGRYFNASPTGTGAAVLNYTLHYTDADVEGYDESKLELWDYEDGNWTEIDFRLDQSANELSANVTSFSTFGAFQEPEPAYLNVTIANMTDPVVANDTFKINATFTNLGEVEANQVVTLDVDDNLVDSKEVTVDAGANVTRTLTWNTTLNDTGSHFAVVESDDDWAWRSFSVLEEGQTGQEANVTVRINSTNSPLGEYPTIKETETLEVTTNVTNVGNQTESQEIALYIEDYWQVDTYNVTLDPGETQFITLEWQTEDGDAGEHNIAVASKADSDVDVVEVDPGQPPYYRVRIINVSEGDSLELTANVTNTGDLDGDSKPIDLTHDGTTYDTTNVSLNSSETETVTLNWSTYPDDGVTDRVYVSSPDDSDWVRTDYNVDIVEVTENGSLELGVNVTNRGELAPVQNITMEYNGSTRDVVPTTVQPGETRRVNLTWETYPSVGVLNRVWVYSECCGSYDSVDGYYDVTIDNTTETEDADGNSTLIVNATIQNTRVITGGNQSVTLTHSGDVKDSTNVVLSPGANQTVTLVWDDYPSGGVDGPITVSSMEDSESRNSFFAVDLLGYNESYSTDNLSMTVRVTNTETLRETQEIRMTYERGLECIWSCPPVGTAYSATLRNATTITLDGGESKVVTLNWTSYPDVGVKDAVFVSSEDQYVSITSNYQPTIVAHNDTVNGTLGLTVNVTNYGELEPLQNITMEYRGTVHDTRPVRINTSETKTINLTWNDYPKVGVRDPVEVHSDEGSDSIRAHFRIRAQEVRDGDVLNVTAKIENTAKLTNTQTVPMVYNGTVRDSKNVTLAGGESTLVNYTWDYPPRGATDPNEVFFYTEHDVDRIKPWFDVEVLDLLEANGELRVRADITSIGHPCYCPDYTDLPLRSTQNITLETENEVYDNLTLRLNGTETKERTLVWNVSEDDIGGTQLYVASEDNRDSIEVPPVIFAVNITNTSAPITEGNVLNVTARIDNLGYERRTQRIEMYIVEERNDEEGVLVDTTNVTVGPQGSEFVNFTWNTEVGDAGDHFAAVSSEDRWDWQWTPVEPEASCRFLAGDAIESSPTIVNGTVYLGSDDGKVYALDGDTCTQLWSFNTSGAVVSSPQVVLGTVYIGSHDDSVYALNATTGTREWQFNTSGNVGSSPTLSNGTLFVGSADGDVYALDASTGTQVWNVSTGGAVRSSPTIENGTVYVGSADGNLYAINTTSGSVTWQRTLGGAVFSSPTVHNDTVYVGSDSGNLTALDVASGAVEWNFSTGGEVDSSPAVINGTVYVGSRDGYVYAVNTTRGDRTWRFEVDRPQQAVVSSPTVAGGVLFVGSGGESANESHLFAVNANTGEEIWRYSAAGAVQSSPTVAADALYVGDHTGRLSKIETDVVGWSGDSRVLHRTLGHHGVGTDEGPVAAFAYSPSDPVVDEQVTFDGTASLGDIASYEWTVPNASNFTSTGDVVNHSFAAAGEYNVTLTVTDTDGRTDNETKTVSVREPGDINVSIVTTNSPVVENETATVTANVTNEGDHAADRTVNLTIDGGVVDQKNVSIAGSSTLTLQFEWDTVPGDAGDHNATVVTEGGLDNTTVRVLDNRSFTINITDYEDGVPEGEPVNVTARVNNSGEVTRTETTRLYISGEGIVDNQSVTLAGGESTLVNFTWGGGPNGTYQATATTQNDSDEVNLTVVEPPDAPNFAVTIDNTSSPVVEGETMRVTATVENVGNASGTQTVNLTIDGAREDATPVTLSVGESTTVSLSWATTSGDAGTHTARVASENDSASTSVEVLAPTNTPNFAVTIDSTSSPDVEGETTTVTATVENVGDASGTQNVSLAIDGAREDATPVSLAPDESTTITLEWPTESGDAGTHTARVASENDSDAATVQVFAPTPAPNFAVSIDSTNSPVVEGETMRVTATVENVGGSGDTQNVTLAVGGRQVDATEVSLGSGDATTVEFTWETAEGDADEYTARVDTANDSDTSPVRVTAPETSDPPNFAVSIDSTNSPVSEGDAVTVTATVENVGESSDTQRVDLAIDGRSVDATEVSLAPGESTTVALTWGTAEGDAGDYTARVATANDTASSPVRVTAPPEAANFDVEITDTNAPVTEGTDVTVTARVENTGNASDGQSVRLRIDGRAVDATDVSLAPGEGTSLEFTWPTEEGDAGEYEATVRSEDDADSEPVTVEEQSESGGGGGPVAPPTNSPPAVVIHPVNATVGEQVTVVPTATDPDGRVVAYEWRVDGAVVSTSEVLTYTFQEAGTHRIAVTVTDDDGATATNATTARVMLPPQANVTTPDPTVGENGTIHGNASDPDGEIEHFEWRINGTVISERPTFNYTFETTGKVNVTLTVTDEDGLTATVSRVIDVNAPPNATILPARPTAGEPTTIGSNASDSDGEVVAYAWRVEDATGTDETITHTFPEPGTYEVTLTVTDDDGATNTTTRTLTVVEPPNAPPQARLSVEGPASVTVCDAVVADAAASSDPDGTITSYRLDLGADGTVENASEVARFNRTFSEPGDHRVRVVVVDDDGATASANVTVSVEDADCPGDVEATEGPVTETRSKPDDTLDLIYFWLFPLALLLAIAYYYYRDRQERREE